MALAGKPARIPVSSGRREILARQHPRARRPAEMTPVSHSTPPVGEIMAAKPVSPARSKTIHHREASFAD